MNGLKATGPQLPQASIRHRTLVHPATSIMSACASHKNGRPLPARTNHIFCKIRTARPIGLCSTFEGVSPERFVHDRPWKPKIHARTIHQKTWGKKNDLGRNYAHYASKSCRLAERSGTKSCRLTERGGKLGQDILFRKHPKIRTNGNTTATPSKMRRVLSVRKVELFGSSCSG